MPAARRRVLTTLLALGAWPCAGWAAASVRARYAAFRAVETALLEQDLDDSARASLLAEAYATLAPDGLAGLTPDELLLVFDAADRLCYLSKAPADARAMAAVLQALPGTPPPALLARTHAALLSARLLAEAAAWRARYPHARLSAPPLTGSVAPGTPAELVLDARGSGLLLRPLPIGSGKQVIAIGHPDCHFCARFLAALDADRDFGRAFAGRLHWLAPQQRVLDLDALRRWNRQHPQAPLAIIYERSAVPMLTRWATPTFYFLQGAVVRTRLDGWPGLRAKPAMLAALQALDAA
ncbi:hypothetical protein [Massilia sp. TS11]|uniref:hypothetical protein n=1 Tax=Massilia sp. TS11 TaxID=2908003 RepID=UPI001EDB6C08|nr:hypothetical protein [Massilia sp. TS11]MCG2586326.1 hypothetical protein [Massilia sp. TS11]